MITRFFDSIARAIYSLGLVTFVMLFVITTMTFFSHTLFLEVFPASMAPWEKEVATWLMAVGWEFTVLVTTCNPKYINRTIPWIVAVASGFIVLFFIQAFDFTQADLILVQRWFIGILAGTINFIYARLFHRKWMERNELAALPSKLAERESTVNELRSTLTEAERKLHETESTLVQFRSDLKERDRDVKQLHLKVKEYEAERTCPWCNILQANPRTLNAHKGHCSKNPKNLNGVSK